jgi:hypothetical protein
MGLDAPKKKPLMSRRLFVGGAVATLAGGALVIKHAADTLSEDRETRELLDVLNVGEAPTSYDTSALFGEQLGSTFTHYTGIRGAVGRQANIDFRYRLAQMWKTKLERMKRFDGRYEPGIVQLAHDAFLTYRPGDTGETNIVDYARDMRDTVADLQARFDVGRILAVEPFRRFSFTQEQAQLLDVLVRQIDATDLLATLATEVAATKEGGALSVRVLDFLLKNAGSKFIDAIPALFDNQLSFGGFQLTPHVVSDRGKGAANGGASIIDAAFGSRVLPKELRQLRGLDHVKAAYLFGIYNLAELVHHLKADPKKGVPDRVWPLLQHLHELRPGTAAGFIAAAHHAPARARKAFFDYADRLASAKGKAHETGYALMPQRVLNELRKPKHDVEGLKFLKQHELELYIFRMRNTRTALQQLLSQTTRAR